MTRIAVVGRQNPGAIDAIRDHTFLLATALRGLGANVDLHLRTPEGDWIIEQDDCVRPRLATGLAAYDVVLIQYNPFMWGRWGFAPWLPLELWRLRRQAPSARVALIVHEPFVPMTGWRWMLMGLWQRTQLAAVRAVSDTVFVSIEIWTRRLAHWWPQRPTFHLPVGSNFPDRSETRDEERLRLGVRADEIVIAVVDTGGSSRSITPVNMALSRLSGLGRRTVLVVLGAGGSLLTEVPPAIEVQVVGRLDPAAFASRLAAADIFLASYVDGVSTRRGSMMAALQHGVPVVGTDGPLTDTVLREAKEALQLAPVEQPALFADAAQELAVSPDARVAQGQAGRILYRERFDWPVIAEELLARLSLRAIS